MEWNRKNNIYIVLSALLYIFRYGTSFEPRPCDSDRDRGANCDPLHYKLHCAAIYNILTRLIAANRHCELYQKVVKKYFPSGKWSHRAYKPQRESSTNGHKH